MKHLEQCIVARGNIINEEVLKVDSIINHQVDPVLMQEIADDICDHFQDKKITKVVTIEASGIAPALLCSLRLQVPMVFLKKAQPSTMGKDMYCAKVHSFTKHTDYILSGSSAYLHEDDNILLVDDFLANGEACLGAINILKQANASIVGIAILIEKAFQPGRERIKDAGYDVYSLARIKHMSQNGITFIKNDDIL